MCAARWHAIPAVVDILVTHGPPWGLLDTHVSGAHLGDPSLTVAVDQRQVGLHLFGHIHEAYGMMHVGTTCCINASICTVTYAPTNAPVVIDL